MSGEGLRWAGDHRGEDVGSQKMQGLPYAGVRIFRKSRWGERKAQDDFHLSVCRLFVCFSRSVGIFFSSSAAGLFISCACHQPFKPLIDPIESLLGG